MDAAVIANTPNLRKVLGLSDRQKGRGSRLTRGGGNSAARGRARGGGIKMPKGGDYYMLPDGRQAYSKAPR